MGKIENKCFNVAKFVAAPNTVDQKEIIIGEPSCEQITLTLDTQACRQQHHAVVAHSVPVVHHATHLSTMLPPSTMLSTTDRSLPQQNLVNCLLFILFKGAKYRLGILLFFVCLQFSDQRAEEVIRRNVKPRNFSDDSAAWLQPQ